MFQFVRAIVPHCAMVPATEPDFIFSISVHIGQAGTQIGNACWELYCLEHGEFRVRSSDLSLILMIIRYPA